MIVTTTLPLSADAALPSLESRFDVVMGPSSGAIVDRIVEIRQDFARLLSSCTYWTTVLDGLTTTYDGFGADSPVEHTVVRRDHAELADQALRAGARLEPTWVPSSDEF